MTIPYDVIGKSYVETEQFPVWEYAERVTFFSVLGEVQDQNVLDVACGTGCYSRLLKQAGARTVVGVDVSPEMIRVAEQEEQRQQLGVSYQVCNALELPVLGEFDVVTATFLLTYAESFDQLATMCHHLFRNLAPQGTWPERCKNASALRAWRCRRAR